MEKLPHLTGKNHSRLFSEREELATQLRTLRKELDHCTFACSSKENQLDTLRSALSAFCSHIHTPNSLQLSLQKRAEELQNALNDTKTLQENSKNNREVYVHLVDRMRATNVQLTFRNNELRETLGNNVVLLNKVKSARTRTSQAKSRARSTLVSFRNSIELEKRIRTHDLSRVTGELRKRNKAKLRKEALVREYQVKLEQDMIQLKSVQAEGLREQLFVYRLWHQLMNRIFKLENRKSKKLEKAFQTIALKTGLSTINMVISRFFTKEEKLSELMGTVRNKEKTLNEYKQRIELMQEKVRNFNVREETNAGTHGECEKTLTDQLHSSCKRLDETTQKHINIQNTCHRLKNWVQKTIERLDFVRGTNTEFNIEAPLSECVQVVRTEIKSMAATGKLNIQHKGPRKF